MLLAYAIKKNAASRAEAQNTYKQNLVMVNNLMISVTTSKLPDLSENPPDWSDYNKTYLKGKGDALDWVNCVLTPLLCVPTEVQNHNQTICLILSNLRKQTSALVNNPSDPVALDLLNTYLNDLSDEFKVINSFISGAVTNIQNFKDKLPDIAKNLKTIADKSAKDAKADQDCIDQMQKKVTKLNDDINRLSATIAGLAIADASALVFGGLITFLAWPVGAAAWFIFGSAVAAATTYIALDGLEIKADNAKIDDLKNRIKGVTADVTTLHLLANSYANMVSESQKIKGNLSPVLAEWESLEKDVNQAITDIRSAISHATAKDFQAILNDINDAIHEWDEAYKQAGALYVHLKANTSELKIGMSSKEVKTAMDNGTTMDIIDYYNMVAAKDQFLHAQPA